MEAHTKWVQIDKALYSGIYDRIMGTAKVFASSTDIDGVEPWSNGKRYILTEWGFADADVPLIKYEMRGDEEEFFLASVSLD